MGVGVPEAEAVGSGVGVVELGVAGGAGVASSRGGEQAARINNSGRSSHRPGVTAMRANLCAAPT